jgi:hypothetical protein
VLGRDSPFSKVPYYEEHSSRDKTRYIQPICAGGLKPAVAPHKMVPCCTHRWSRCQEHPRKVLSADLTHLRDHTKSISHVSQTILAASHANIGVRHMRKKHLSRSDANLFGAAIGLPDTYPMENRWHDYYAFPLIVEDMKTSRGTPQTFRR